MSSRKTENLSFYFFQCFRFLFIRFSFALSYNLIDYFFLLLLVYRWLFLVVKKKKWCFFCFVVFLHFNEIYLLLFFFFFGFLLNSNNTIWFDFDHCAFDRVELLHFLKETKQTKHKKKKCNTNSLFVHKIRKEKTAGGNMD